MFKCSRCLWQASHHIRFQFSKIDAAEQAQDDCLVVHGAANILTIPNSKLRKKSDLFSIYCFGSIVFRNCFHFSSVEIENIGILVLSTVDRLCGREIKFSFRFHAPKKCNGFLEKDSIRKNFKREELYVKKV